MVHIELDAKIERVRIELEAKIERLRIELTAKIEAVETRLDARIDTVAAELVVHRWLFGVVIAMQAGTMELVVRARYP